MTHTEQQSIPVELVHRFPNGNIMTLEVDDEFGRVWLDHGGEGFEHRHVYVPPMRRDYAIDRFEKAKAAG